MAITNAQQYKQLMNEGGPMRQIKGQDHMLAYITPGERDTLVDLGGQETMTPEGILAYPPGMGDPNYDGSGGGNYAGSGGNKDTGSNFGQFTRAVNRTKNNPTTVTPSGDGSGYVDTIQRIAEIEKKKKEARDDGGFRTTGSQVYSPPSFFQDLKNKGYQSSINRNKVESLRKMSLLDKGLPGFFGKVINGLTGKVPDWAKDMTEEEINEMAADIQGIKDYNQATYNYNLNPTKKGSGSELLGRTFDAQDILDSGEMTQSKYEELFPGPTLSKDEGSGDPCKGPNPPAYCFIGANADENIDAQEEEPFQRNFRLMADGGRAALAEGGMPYEGGIMDLETSRQMYGLGKLVKKITRGVKKVAKSPIGKAALGAALFKFGGGFGKGPGSMFTKLFGANNTMPGFANISTAKMPGFLSKIGLTQGYGSIMPTALGGIAATTLGSYFLTPEEEEEQKLASLGADIDDPSYIMNNPSLYTNRRLAAEGGSMDEPVAKKTMPLLDMDGKEMDLREEGGFVPLGRMERADDVPARLSKNEFVFTADAVRNAGEGDVDKGAEVMYNMMKNLESGGDVSEESQGLEGAREMFQTSQRLEEVI